jgi:hypothetical protein
MVKFLLVGSNRLLSLIFPTLNGAPVNVKFFRDIPNRERLKKRPNIINRGNFASHALPVQYDAGSFRGLQLFQTAAPKLSIQGIARRLIQEPLRVIFPPRPKGSIDRFAIRAAASALLFNKPITIFSIPPLPATRTRHC